jgi:hypothetical protein
LDQKSLKLAKTIIELDEHRDELFEELITRIGSQAHELLRVLQNKIHFKT